MKKKFLIPEVKSVSMQPTEILAISGAPGGSEGKKLEEGGGAAKIGSNFNWN